MYRIRHFMIHPYPFDEKWDKFVELLEEKYNIPCIVQHRVHDGVKIRILFDVSDLHPQLEELNGILPQETFDEELLPLSVPRLKDSISIGYSEVYSEEERQQAKWLIAWNTTPKVDPVNLPTVDRYDCFVKRDSRGESIGRHEVQNELYVLKSPIKWGRGAFISAYGHQERLFCSDRIRDFLLASDITGITFEPVLRKSTMQPMPDIHQVVFTHQIPDGALVAAKDTTEYVCKQCGMHMLQIQVPNRFKILDGFMDESIDFWETQPMFLASDVVDPTRGRKQLIISQKAYRFLREMKMDRGFGFKPIL